MKNLFYIAEEIGVSQDFIHDRLSSEFTRRFHDHIEERDGAIYFDSEAEELIKFIFQKKLPQAAAANPIEWVQQNDAWILKNEPFDGAADELPALHWMTHSLCVPLSYPAEVLRQALDRQRQEFLALWVQLDSLAENLLPTDYSSLIDIKKRNAIIHRERGRVGLP